MKYAFIGGLPFPIYERLLVVVCLELGIYSQALAILMIYKEKIKLNEIVRRMLGQVEGVSDQLAFLKSCSNL